MLSRALKILLLLTAVIPAAGQIAGGGDATFEVPRTLRGMVIEPSPEACQLGKYVDCPVTHATGALGVEIPLYSWDAGSGHTVGISLSYHTSGVRVEDIAGPAGLGWTLNAGGSISRRIVGLPDEAKGVDHRAIGGSGESIDLGYLRAVFQHETDADYDIYTYNIPGYSGNFYIRGGTPVSLPKSDLKIELVSSTEAPGDFVITTPDGAKYYFAEKEHVSYRLHRHVFRNGPVYLPDYTGVSTWHLSKIVLPEGRDEILYEYVKIPSWERHRTDDSKSVTYRWSTSFNDNGVVRPDGSTRGTASEYITTFPDQRLIKSISTRTATVEFEHKTLNISGNRKPSVCYAGFRVKNRQNTVVREISLTVSDYLSEVTVKSGETLLDKRTFGYYAKPGGASGKDFFGFHNAANTTTVVTEKGEWDPARRSDIRYAVHGALRSMTDAMGAETRFYYSMNHSCEYLKMTGKPSYCPEPGIRIDSIVTADAVSGRKRTRAFGYMDERLSMDLSLLDKSAFTSLSGTKEHSVTRIAHVLTATLSTGSVLSGAQPENAVVYYGKVTETITGTDLDKWIMTDYEYDLSRCRHPFVGGMGRMLDGYEMDKDRFLVPYSGFSPGVDGSIFSRATSNYYWKDLYIDNRTPLKKVIRYEKGRVAETTEYRYSVVDSVSYSLGFHCERLVKGIKGSWESDEYKSMQDFNYYDTEAVAMRIQKDSVITTRYFADGSTRRSVTRYTYDRLKRLHLAKAAPWMPQFDGDSVKIGDSGLPLSIVTSCCGITLGQYRCYADNISKGFFKDAAERGLKSLPVMEKWVVDGKDSIMQEYAYGRFNNITLPVRITLGRPGRRPMDSQRVTGYNSHGKPAGVSTLGKAAVLYTWDAWDNLLSTCVEGTGLLNRYEHLPLVGCTRTELSSGKIRRYAYTGGRLTGISNKFNTPLSQYRYGLYASNKKAGNFVEESARNSLNGWMVTRRHFDGFGDNYLTYGIGLGGDGETVVSGTKFDAVGRPVRVMVPVTGSHSVINGLPGVIDQDNFDWVFEDLCPEGANATVLSYRDGLADDRAVVTQSPGDELAGHPARAAFSRCNSVSVAKYKCRRYTVSGNMLRYAGDFDAGVLDVTESIDPDGREMLTFTDFRGFKLLERRVLGGSDFLDTYYINDAWGNPRVVVQPEGSQRLTGVGAGWSLVSEPILNDYAFVYEYDECMRVVSKKLPGCEPVRYCYDRCGQLAFSQDGNQRDEGRRMFYLYDTAGRPTLTGLCDAPATWAAYTDTAMISSRADNRAIDKTYYSAPVALGNPKMLNAWYYDTYINLPDHYYDLSVVRHGLLTISSSALMPPVGDQDRIVTSNYYDWEDRLCESTTDIAGGGTINTHTVYTLSDQVDSVWVYTRLPNDTIVDRYKYRYDHADRLKSVTFYHDGDAPVVLAVNGYDALGRLATAKLPGETVSYAYNVRNALTSITSPRFSQQLRYAAGAANPCYNGNIAEAVTQGNKYAYTYDNANRLISAKYTPSAGNADYSATYAYDRNSNITALTRKGLTGRLGTFGTVDDLVMTYDGNQLSKVTETADEILLETSHDMQPMAITRPTVSQFRYDANGNTTMDYPRKISSIAYNPLNLPQSVSIDNSPNNLISNPANRKYISYTYDASGVKHRVIHSSTKPDVSPTGRLTTADTTLYVGSRIYLNGKLDKVLTPYGYLQGGKFHTWLHDYQGNVAVVVVGDSVTQRNSYYPYGLPHATSSFMTNVTFTTPNTHKYSGKEFDTFGGTDLYDFHARYHAPSTGRFMTIDPMAEKYPGISPYMYCAGNPVLFVDPSGMKIDEASKGDWDKLKEEIKDKMSELVNEVSGVLNSGGDVGDMSLRIQSLNGTLKGMNGIEESSQTYSLNKIEKGRSGYLSRDTNTDIITINYESTSNFVHEVTHAQQFENGDIAFFYDGTILQDIYDETNAYKAQYSFDPKSVTGLNSIEKGITNYTSINAKWVQGLLHPTKGTIYAPNSINKTAVESININSTIQDLRRAYPSNSLLRTIPDGFVRNIPNLYYKQ